MSFTYQLPAPSDFLHTLMIVINNNGTTIPKWLGPLLSDAILEFNETTDYSRNRWDAYKLGITFRISAKVYPKFSTLKETDRKKLKELCTNILPAECGYDINDINIVPMLESDEKDASKIISESIANEPINKLSSDIIETGKKMTNAYLLMFCLENKLREFIDSTLSSSVGNQYETQINIPNNVKAKIESRKNEEQKNKWLPVRGSKFLYYLDFIELEIIIVNNWEQFKQSFPNQEWIKSKINELYGIRCLIAHNSIIDDISYQVLCTSYKQIVKQIAI